jgi:hypothetical protein
MPNISRVAYAKKFFKAIRPIKVDRKPNKA